ncbi:hypothetical protein MTO96_039876 [Rhipicephalus appendiculatus]
MPNLYATFASSAVWRPKAGSRHCPSGYSPRTSLSQRDTMNPEAKYVYVARNPWDTCVSFYHMATSLSMFKFHDGTFDEFLDAFLRGDFGYGDYFDHVASGYALRKRTQLPFLDLRGPEEEHTQSGTRTGLFSWGPVWKAPGRGRGPLTDPFGEVNG